MVRVEEPAGAAEVEGEAVAAEDDGQDLRGAGQASGLGGGDAVAGEVVAGDEAGAEEVGGGEVGLECVEGDGDHERGGVPAVDREPGGVEGLEELDERLAHPLRVRQPRHRVTGRAGVAGPAARATRGLLNASR